MSAEDQPDVMPPRQPKGQPAGGQFASMKRDEADHAVTLLDERSLVTSLATNSVPTSESVPFAATRWGAIEIITDTEEWTVFVPAAVSGVAVVVEVDGFIVLNRMHRRATAIENWELPMGLSDAGETPQQSAVREVHEETGITVSADSLVPLGEIHPSPANLRQTVHLFFARGTGSINPLEDEAVEVSWAKAEDVVSAAVDGLLTNSMTALAVLRARARGLI